RSGGLLWLTNVIVFALWYWRLDGGGDRRVKTSSRSNADCGASFRDGAEDDLQFRDGARLLFYLYFHQKSDGCGGACVKRRTKHQALGTSASTIFLPRT